MILYRCDICGADMAQRKMWTLPRLVKYSGEEQIEEEHYDLCYKCAELLANHIQENIDMNKKRIRKERGYEEE